MFWIVALSSLKTQAGQQWAMNRIIYFIEHQTNSQVTVGNVDILFPFTLRIDDLNIRKEEQNLISIKQLDIGCRTSHLLEGRLICPLLYARDVYVSKMVSTLNPPSQSSSHARWDDYILPIYLRVQNILIEDLHIDPELIDELVLAKHQQTADLLKQAVFQVQGNISNNPFKKAVAANLSILAIDTLERHPPIQFTFNVNRHNLALAFHLKRFPLAFLIDYPINLDASYYASAPLSTWQKTLEGVHHDGEPIIGNFRFSLEADHTDPFLSSLIGSDSQIKGKYLLTPFQHLNLSDFVVDTPCCQVNGQTVISYSYQIENGQLKGRLQQLEKLAPWLPQTPKGLIDFQASFSGSIDKPSISLELASPVLYLHEDSFHDLTAHLTTERIANTFQGNVQVEISHNQIPYQMQTSFVWVPEQSLSLPQLQFHALGTELTGKAALHLSDWLLDGNLHAHSNDLALLSPFLGIPLRGSAKLQLDFQTTQNSTQEKVQDIKCQLHCHEFYCLDLHSEELIIDTHLMNPFNHAEKHPHFFSQLQGKGIQWQDWTINQCHLKTDYVIDLSSVKPFSSIALVADIQQLNDPHMHVTNLSVSSRMENPYEFSQGELAWSAHQIQFTNGYQFDELAGQTQFNPKEVLWPFQLKVNGHMKEHVRMAASGYWHIKDNLIETRINECSGQFNASSFHLLNPVLFVTDQENWKLSDLNLQWGEGTIQAHVLIDKNHISSQLIGKQISSDFVHFFNPELPLNGKFSLTAQLEGPLDRLQGQAHLFLHHIQIREKIFANNPSIEGEVHFNLTDKGINLKSTLYGIGRNPVIAEGILPLMISLSPPSVFDHPELPFHVTIQAEGELDPYLHLFYNDTTNLSGQTKIALVLQGKLKEPQIQGAIDLHNGSYESLGTGAIYKNIQARLEGDGSQLVLRHFSAEDKNQGSITARGLVHLDSTHQFPFEFQIEPKYMYIMDSDYASISASGPLILTGNRNQAKLKGALTTNTAAIHMEEVLPSQVKSVDITYINVPQGEKIPTYAQTKEASWLELDVKLNVSSLEIKGKNLNSDWKGSVTINGNMENLLLNGDLRISKGEYNFNGKVFSLTQGNIHFAGPIDKKTSLYVVASKDIDRIKAEIILKGPMNKLAISFRSNPPLSQREVLSYILFNRGISDITTDQGTQLTQSFMSLNSTSPNDQTTTDFLTRLRNNMGIDRLDFGSSASTSNDMGLQIGKYLTEGVFFSINKSMNDTSGYTGAIEAKLRKNVKAEVQVDFIGEDRQGKVSLKWKKDY